MKKITLLTTILLLSLASQAQDSTKVIPKGAPIEKAPTPPSNMKIFIFSDEAARALFGMIAVCPDDINVGVSVNTMKGEYKRQYEHQPVLPTDTTGKAIAPVKKKKK